MESVAQYLEENLVALEKILENTDDMDNDVLARFAKAQQACVKQLVQESYKHQACIAQLKNEIAEVRKRRALGLEATPNKATLLTLLYSPTQHFLYEIAGPFIFQNTQIYRKAFKFRVHLQSLEPNDALKSVKKIPLTLQIYSYDDEPKLMEYNLNG